MGTMRNGLYEFADGDFNINIDDDDVYTKDYTKTIVSRFEMDEKVGMVFGGVSQKINIQLNGKYFFYYLKS